MREITESEIEEAILRGQIDITVCQMNCQMKKIKEEQAVKRQRDELAEILSGIGMR